MVFTASSDKSFAIILVAFGTSFAYLILLRPVADKASRIVIGICTLKYK